MKELTMKELLLRVSMLMCVSLFALAGGATTDPVDPRIAEIDGLMTAYEHAGTFSGVVLVAEDGDVIYERAVGLANHEWAVPNGLDTRFRIASVSKLFTQVLIRQLCEDGALSLNDTLADALPGYAGPDADRITVRHLLEHRSGIVNESAVSDLDLIERDYYTRERMLDLIAGYELALPPGTRYIYSNFGYYLLGAIIEAVSGQTYTELLQERICRPAGMSDTFPEVTAEIMERRASGHWLDDEGILTIDVPLDMSFVFGYGQLVSTARDLLLFEQALRAEQLLNSANTRAVFTLEAEYRPLGDGQRRAYAFESGPASINGFRAGLHSYLREGRVVIVLMNVRGPGAVPVFDVGRNLAAILYDAPYDMPLVGAPSE